MCALAHSPIQCGRDDWQLCAWHTEGVGWTLHADICRDLCAGTACKVSGLHNDEADKDETSGSAGEGEGGGGVREGNTSGKEGKCSNGGRQIESDLRSINLTSTKVR